MALVLEDEVVVQLATRLAERRNVTPTQVLRDALTREWSQEAGDTTVIDAVKKIQAKVRALSDPERSVAGSKIRPARRQGCQWLLSLHRTPTSLPPAGARRSVNESFKLGKPRSNYQTQAGDEETQRDPFGQHGEPHRGPHDLRS